MRTPDPGAAPTGSKADEEWAADGAELDRAIFISESAIGGRTSMTGAQPEVPDGLAIDPQDLTLLELVGTGCTAEVYRGLWQGKVVAIKQIVEKRSRMQIKEQVAFAREMSILAKVKHENIVKFHGVCFLERPLRIVTAFCEGGACFELLHNSPEIELCFSQQLKMCYDVAKAMLYLHHFTPQIIHRDLKSLNLLLQEVVRSPQDVPWVKVSDFGVARIKEVGNAAWGKMTIQAGTKHWMAPEMWQGTDYDEKVDVYSYAMVLYEVLCQEVPFEEEDPADVGKFTLGGIRPDLEAVPPDCPDVLRSLMISCWAHDPKQRPGFDTIVKILEPLGPPQHPAAGLKF